MDSETWKKLDRATKDYFSNRGEKIAEARRLSTDYAARPDTKAAWTSKHGFMIRNAVHKPKFSEGEKRSIAMCALWAEWKSKQLGRSLKWEDIPLSARPVLK